MFRSPTVFVIGAGASKEVGLPIGVELTRTISKHLDMWFEHFEQKRGSFQICDALRIHAQKTGGRDIGASLQAALHIRDSMPLTSSIDQFMDNHRADPNVMLVGKLAIVQSILEGEQASKLFISDEVRRNTGASAGYGLPYEDCGDTWFVRFFKVLSEGVTAENVDRIFDNVSIVSFNYDRCLEHFLLLALQTVYKQSEDAAFSTLDRLKIIHPYGSVGPFGRNNRLPFGAGFRGSDLLDLSQQIKIFTEQIDVPELVEEIKTYITRARTIAFLGFGYNAPNMSLLQPRGDPAIARIYGTGFGFSEPDRAVIRRQLIGKFSGATTDFANNINIVDKKCSELFDEYSLSLSAP